MLPASSALPRAVAHLVNLNIMKLHWTILPILVIGVALGTLIALAIAGEYAKSQLQSTTAANPLLGALGV